MKSLLISLQHHAQRLRASRFVRNVASVATGVAAAQAISLAFMPFLTRLYGPEAFGALAAYTAVVSIIIPVSTMGFAGAIVMPPTEDDAVAMVRLALACAALLAPLSLVLVWLLQPQLSRWTGLQATSNVLYLIPISLLLNALLSIASQAAIRKGFFNAKARSHVASTLLMNIGKLTGGVFAPSGIVLIAIGMLGAALSFTLLLARVPPEGIFRVKNWYGAAGLRAAAFAQRDFPLYRMPQGVINAASLGLPVILLTALFGPATAGQYSLTTLILGAPVALLGQSVADVFFPKFTAAIRENPPAAVSLLNRATVVMTALAVAPFTLIAATGDIMFPWVLGSEWERAGQFSQWIAVWMGGVLVTGPAIAAMPVLRLQGALLAHEVLIAGARVGALVFGSHLNSDLVAVAAFAVVNTVGNLLLLALVLTRAGAASRARMRV